MDARASSNDNIHKEELQDIATCCVCNNVYTDPKILPCGHTSCVKCLQQTGYKINKGPGDKMPCPFCRQQFKIPTDGFRGLPKNFFIEKLMQVANISNEGASPGVLCTVCMEESNEEAGKEIPVAYTYCVDCKHKLCQECCSEHRKFKLTKKHKLVPINERELDQSSKVNPTSSVCERHEGKVLDVYCADCKTVVCAICFIDDHKNHEGAQVSKFVDGFRKEVESNAEAINDCIWQAQMKKVGLLKTKKEFQLRVKNLECEITKRNVEIKQYVLKHANSLLRDLISKGQSRLKEIQMATDDVDACLSSLESYNSCCQKMVANGSASDICRAISDLSAGAVELQEQCRPIIEREVQSFNFYFKKSELEELLEKDCSNLLGQIEEEGDSKRKERSKKSPIADASKEAGLQRKEIEIERTNKESLPAVIEQPQLIMNKEKEVQANKPLTEALNKESATCTILKQYFESLKIINDALLPIDDKQKQEPDKENVTSTLYAVANKLKQELDKANMTNDSFQADDNEFLQEESKFETTAETLETDTKKLVPDQELMSAEPQYKSEPVLVQTIRAKTGKSYKWITGLAILDQELFVVSKNSSEIDVYDMIRFSLSCQWNLSVLIDPEHIVSCNRNRCLYIYDYKGSGQAKEILRVDPTGKLIKNWSAGDGRDRLSVTDESNVILTLSGKHKLSEYSPDGQLIHEIDLSGAGIFHPGHAIKLSNGHFMVSYAWNTDEMPGVCVVDTDGSLKKSVSGECGSAFGKLLNPLYLSAYGNGFVLGECGSAFGKLLNPLYLSAYRNGFVLADEIDEFQVFLLDLQLEFKTEILSKGKHRLRKPSRILLDQTSNRLFVADNGCNDEQILIFDLE